MSDSRTSSLTSALSSLAVAFDAGQLTSDGGLVWLAQADDRLGLVTSSAARKLPLPSRISHASRVTTQSPDGARMK